ncbi:hypothetical protein [Paenibacillus naphthalenovorans]|uniref:hypothetical protein n=1 Tax=Paenibacillus naphthalenovorans TaxID=162209 RepID=UPI003D2B2169|nr:hypothetical protein [Paenibacillus sp. JMULE4]
MYDQGFELQYESDYLLKRNWLQIAALGALKDKDIRRMPECLNYCMKRPAARDFSLLHTPW